MVGGRRSIVDAYVTPMLNWAASLLKDEMRTYPALSAHHERMLADPAVRHVMISEGLITA